MKNWVILIGLVFGITNIVIGQKVDLNNSVSDYIKKSTPQATQFQKYGDLPVNTNTGAVEINVPMFNIGIKGVDWNVNIGYHTGGIKVSEVAGCVGLGWSLNAGGMISSRIYQRSDVFLGNFGDSSAFRRGFMLSPINNPAYNSACTYSNSTDVGVVDYINSQKANEDTKFQINYIPDIFFLNAGGLSSKFFLKKDTGYCLPSKDISIVHIPGAQANNNSYPGSWLVIDENGVKYTFEIKGGSSTNYPGNYSEGASANPSYYSNYNPVFALTQIENPFGEKINFYYSTECYTYRNNDQDVYHHYDTTQANGCSNSGNGLFGPEHHVVNTEICDARIDSIATTDGQLIVFKYSSRSDLLGASKLDTAILYSRLLSTTNFIKAYSLSSSYFGSGSDPKNLRLRLDSVKELNAVHATNSQYSFGYDSDSLPSRISPAQDSAGYYNGHTENFTLVPVPVAWGGGNRSYSLTHTKACSLKQVKYPTGGFTLLDYELKPLGGLRIKTIKDSTNSTTVNLRQYEYGTPYMAGSNGSYNFSKDYNGYQYVCPNTTQPKIEILCPFTATYSEPLESLSDSYFGDKTERYLSVTEYYGSSGENGKIEYKYTDPALIVQSGMIGQDEFLTEKNIYKKNGASYDLISKEKKKYSVLETTGTMYTDATNSRERRAWGLDFDVLRDQFETGSGDCGTVYNSSTCFPSLYFQISLRLVSSPIMLKADTAILISNDTFLTSKTYLYNVQNTLSPICVLTNDSKGNIRIEKVKYPSDFNGITTSDTLSAGIKNLRDKHIIEPKIETSTYLQNSDSSNTRLISSNFMSYRKDLPVPYRVYRIPVSTPIADFAPATVSSGNISKDSRYETSVLFNSYDIKGDLVEQQKVNDVKQNYIWDYSYKYPIAQIVNADSSSVGYTSFEADGKGGWSYSGTTAIDTTSPTGTKCYNLAGGNITKSNLASSTYVVSFWEKNSNPVSVNGSSTPIRTGKTIDGWTYFEFEVTSTSVTISGSQYVDEVRLYPKGAQMKTFTYEPLIGIINECDEVNRIKYYKYDTFGRLRLVKDQDKNILKVFDYQFSQNQNQ